MILQETLPASYAGVNFLTLRSEIQGGRKDALKEFPNSNLQNIEDLGLRPRSYSITAIVNPDSSGDNYVQRRDNFLRVLEKGGTDVLIHPLYGRIENIVVRTFTLIEDFTALGEARFSINFALDTTEGTPVLSADTLSIVNNRITQALTAVNQYVTDNFNISNTFPINFTEAVSKANDIVDAFEENTTFLQVVATGIDRFTEELVEFQSNITSLVNSPAGLVNSVSRLFDTVNEIYTNNESTFEVIERFFDFGDEDEGTPIQTNTAGRVERSRNQNLLNNLVKASALLLNYGNASQITFTTVTQVQQFADTLETQYQKVISQAEFDSQTLETIAQTRLEVQQFFEQQRLTANQVVSVNTVQLPARVIAYQYYGSSAQGVNIADLNEDINLSFLEGNIEVFTE